MSREQSLARKVVELSTAEGAIDIKQVGSGIGVNLDGAFTDLVNALGFVSLKISHKGAVGGDAYGAGIVAVAILPVEEVEPSVGRGRENGVLALGIAARAADDAHCIICTSRRNQIINGVGSKFDKIGEISPPGLIGRKAACWDADGNTPVNRIEGISA